MKINKMKDINLTGLPVIGGMVTAVIIWFVKLNLLWTIVSALTVFIFLFVILIPHYLWKMIDIYSPHFHLPTYKRFRPNEFELLNQTVLDKQFSYSGLAEYVNGVVTKQADELKVVEAIIKQFNYEKEEYKREIQKLNSKEKEIIEEFTDAIENLDDELEWSETVIMYLIEFIQDIYVVMHRIASGIFNYSDLKLISGFTIYQVEDNELRRIADEGTTGQTPIHIKLNRPYHTPWVQTIVDAAKNNKQLVFLSNQPRAGYHVVSFKFFLQNSKKTWVFSLQIHESTNQRGFLLSLSDDIIDQTVIYEMLYGLCMILDDNQEKKKIKGGKSSHGNEAK
ncbi:hypothetical protein [Radiobacillus sp. PE A8.2]|uniref:hypothetical protein n=1 Tax=Radiobacillus sp. PE A8.2 TaxID=3380349 RepID=UPI00388E2429